MGFQKKHGKDRLDKWYKLAKEKGYRARAAFKLIQLNHKYGFLQRGKILLDLCAAPGSWSQVAAEAMPSESLIIGVDIVPIKPVPRVITIQADITTDKCSALIRSTLKSWEVDTVVHDGAPNVGTAWVQDAFSQAGLVLQAIKLAIKFLRAGGTFVTKIFRSKDYNALLWVLQQLFASVEATKPPASRNISAEIYVVCTGFKAPKHLDPRFLDPRHVFAELPVASRVDEARVLKPELKRKRREGYEDAEWSHFKETSAVDFIESDDPITMLGTLNRLNFGHPASNATALEALSKIPETSREIKACCEDLKVLGKKELRALLRWRQKCRTIMAINAKQEERVDEKSGPFPPTKLPEGDDESFDSLRELRQQSLHKERKRKRKENQIKRRQNHRMNLLMQPPTDIGLGQAEIGGGSAVSRFSSFNRVESSSPGFRARSPSPSLIEENKYTDSDSSSDEEADQLDAELDYLYEQYRVRKSSSNVKNGSRSHLPHDLRQDGDDSPDVDDSRFSGDIENMHDALGTTHTRTFFEQASFESVDGLTAIDDGGVSSSNAEATQVREKANSSSQRPRPISSSTIWKLDSVEHSDQTPKVVARNLSSYNNEERRDQAIGQSSSTSGNSSRSNKLNNADIELVTAEAMALAQQIAVNRSSSRSFADDAYNKNAFDDQRDLPSWFLDDEREFNTPVRPKTAEAIAAIKKKVQGLNSRPIKKVREAKQRKKQRAARRLQKIQKRSGVLNDTVATYARRRT